MATSTTPTRKAAAAKQLDHSKAEAAVASAEEAAGAEPGKLAEKQETEQQLKNRLRNEAEREVLNDHKDEVIKITEAKYRKHGLKYVRRLTDEEKAAKAIEEYYQQFPNLRPVTVVQADPEPQPEESRDAFEQRVEDLNS